MSTAKKPSPRKFGPMIAKAPKTSHMPKGNGRTGKKGSTKC